MFKKKIQLLASVMYAADISIAGLSWIIAYFVRFYIFGGSEDIPPIEGYLHPLPLICGLWFLSYHFTGLYRSRRINPAAVDMKVVLKAGVFASLAFLSIIFFYRGATYSRTVFAIFFALNTGLMMAGRWAMKLALRSLREKGYNRRTVLILGAGSLGRRVLRRLESAGWMGYDILGFLDDSRPEGSVVAGRPVLGRLSGLKAMLKANGIDDVYIALSFKETDKLPGLMKTLSHFTASVRIVPDIYRTVTLNASTEDLDGLPVITMVESPLYGWGSLVKRGFDVIFSAAALAALSPLMLMIAVAVRLSSHGPAIYVQERMSLNGRKFPMYKFRSMRVAGDGGGELKVSEGGPRVVRQRDDPRITFVGRILRRTNLDELPQLVNVLKGDMSVVGPRPERPHLVDKLKKSVPGYMLKHKINSGITGWAQVNGWRGETSIKRRVAHDLFYIEHWSLWFDIKIIFLTMLRSFSDKNAY